MPRSHPGTSSMYPGLHDDVQTRLESNGLKFNFRKNGDKKNHTNSYDSHIMGRFTCANKNCIADGWTSKKIAVTIRQFPGNEYNAEVYHQRCLKCNWLSKPKLDDSYADRVAYRLKKWSGMHVEPRPFSGDVKGEPETRKEYGSKPSVLDHSGFGMSQPFEEAIANQAPCSPLSSQHVIFMEQYHAY
ncbi:uncharacterized protein BBA_09449 [Beauveria bassiana ARSEF 2860]|uniref:3CxxC-type domain-containing protein n=1 Tax=Beauveria bassiana (strain ARSEF 2860) TaxID=655819 RepID=J5JCL4_BEAB2|nr:uncharacterized protein BBA_09449 [Beauveria bassiana ARSEF 2860]EJP61606.1 hypothetical protein BBA_09449 [Beauveria bassiana ARSEF 2860]